MSATRRDVIQGATVAAALSAAGIQASAAADLLYVIAEVVAKAGSESTARSLLIALAEKSRTEPGCKSYSVLNVASEPGRFFTFEAFADEAAFKAHMGSAHVTEMLPKLGPLLAKPPSQTLLNPVSVL